MDDHNSTFTRHKGLGDEDDAEIVKIVSWDGFQNYFDSKKTEAVHKVTEFWNALGMDDKGVSNRRQYFASQFREFISKFVDAERMHNHMVQKSVLDAASEVEKLASELNYTIPIITDLDKKPLQLLDELRSLSVNMTLEKESRIKRKNDLVAQIKKICDVLGQQPPPELSSTKKRTNGTPNRRMACPTPTETSLAMLEGTLARMEGELNSRKEALHRLRASITDILLNLGRDPKNSKYDPVLNTTQNNFSENYIDAVQRLHNELLDESQHCLAKYNSLWKDIEYWWHKLESPPEECEDVRQKLCRNYGLDTIQELERVKESIIRERLSTIGQCAERQRKLLKRCLKQCYAFFNTANADIIGGEGVYELAANKFDPHSIVMNTEAYLIQLESAVDTVTLYINENAAFFEMIKRREELWSELCVFESTPLTSERLRNRGGILLKEEKTRNRIYKELPAIQEQLVRTIEQWQEKYSSTSLDDGSTQPRVFYWEHGEPYAERICNQLEGRIRLHGVLQHPDSTPGKASNVRTPCASRKLERPHDTPPPTCQQSCTSSVSTFSTPTTRRRSRTFKTPLLTPTLRKNNKIHLSRTPSGTDKSSVVTKQLKDLPSMPSPLNLNIRTGKSALRNALLPKPRITNQLRQLPQVALKTKKNSSKDVSANTPKSLRKPQLQ